MKAKRVVRNSGLSKGRTVAQFIRKQFKEHKDSAATLKRVEKEAVWTELFGRDDTKYTFSDGSTILHQTITGDFVI